MKSCPLCGTETENDAGQCQECSYEFVIVDSSIGKGWQDDAGSEGREVQPPRRPDGVTPMIFGWFCLIVAIVALVVAINGGPSQTDLSLATGPYASSSSAERVAHAIATQWIAQITAGAFFSLFLILWSVGYIVNAISFLPGKEQ